MEFEECNAKTERTLRQIENLICSALTNICNEQVTGYGLRLAEEKLKEALLHVTHLVTALIWDERGKELDAQEAQAAKERLVTKEEQEKELDAWEQVEIYEKQKVEERLTKGLDPLDAAKKLLFHRTALKIEARTRDSLKELDALVVQDPQLFSLNHGLVQSALLLSELYDDNLRWVWVTAIAAGRKLHADAQKEKLEKANNAVRRR